MFEPFVEVSGLLIVAAMFVLALRGLSGRLRRRFLDASALEEPMSDGVGASDDPPRDPNGRYFLLAIVGFALHAGSFYFYLWGAAAEGVGLAGLMVMLGVGFCLMVAIFYSWACGGPWVDGSVAGNADVEPDETAD